MLEILKARFQDNKNLHMELSWLDVEKRLLEHQDSMDVLRGWRRAAENRIPSAMTKRRES